MGAEFPVGYPDLWDGIKPYFDKARETGTGVEYSPAQALIVERGGYREEAYFNGSFIPIGNGPTTQPQGFYNVSVEVTTQRLADRRTMLLNRLASVPHLGLSAACDHIVETLKTDGEDIPLAVLYEAEQTPESTVLRLRGHIGLPTGHNLIVDNQDISSNEGLVPDCRNAGLEPVIIDYDERFDSITWAGWGSPSKKIAILPITSGSRVLGYLIAGTNPYRSHDESCKQFIKDLSRMVSSIVSAAVGTKEIKVRQEQLENDLALSDMRLRHLIEHASVGMCHLSLDGHTIWANDHYYTLAGVSPESHQIPFAFFDVYIEEDKRKAFEVWDSLLAGLNHVSIELRLKRQYSTPVGDSDNAQVQVLAFPYRENGEVKSIMACTTDISKLKWAQSFQARLAAEAREAKRQQEAFIDVVSHEMRNPLSAIVHCADGILSAVEECRAKLANIPEPCLEALNDNLTSAKIIMQCANHQKRIIDDVLTLSKLDSMLLSITPTVVRPVKLVHSIITIFEPELKASNIQYTISPDQSLEELNVDHLYLDPSRVTQIFINLITNAIKFVKTSTVPSISVRYGVCKSNPRSFFPADTFWATKTKEPDDVTTNPEWGNGEPIYLTFAVHDTGIGLKEMEIHKIFERFRQANTKTHVKYGGSGLGLFISKQLTEKQGGEIGVSSVSGQGSTFGFYVKARRVERRLQTLGELPQDSGTDGQTMQQLQVLLVEDNIINQQVLGRQLKKAGCSVDVANHGLEALDMLEKKVFDVVLMDLEMPVLNGLAATKEIRKREVEREGLLGQAMQVSNRGVDRLPIIAVTANVRQEQIDTAIAAGADRVMQKPFKAADLVFMMKGLVPQITTPGVNERLGGLSLT
ncbi:autoinducer 2 sensor kinase/phosphatase luxQ [Periconia macrospinosa]|uniref:histidine kinase n=1 Tax=Periconia macrospinosa TaxID=97972 RepID=A0A2V1EAV7_9PLEO|nr:autoinducer 2 sensor kinase/phosphatase luxQ [Periconia macrospinosa]